MLKGKASHIRSMVESDVVGQGANCKGTMKEKSKEVYRKSRKEP